MNSVEFGRIIRQNRVAQGLRQAQLAAAVGVGLRFLIELEGGKPTAHLGKALAIVKALGCRIDILPPQSSRQS